MSLINYLSKHPRCILDNELSPLILAWIERTGLITENEINSVFNDVDKLTLTNNFAALYQNRLIEYRANWIKISYNGKEILDRFDIGKEIVDSIISSFINVTTSKELFFNFLLDMRNYNYHQYLYTLFALKLWDFLSYSLDDSNKSGKLAILLREFNKSPSILTDNEHDKKKDTTPLFISANNLLDKYNYYTSRNSSDLIESNETLQIKLFIFFISKFESSNNDSAKYYSESIHDYMLTSSPKQISYYLKIINDQLYLPQDDK